jgi:hypothetical protein
MSPRLILLILLLSTACQSGIIPCPKIKTVRAKKTVIHKRFMDSSESLSADASDAKNEDRTSSRRTRGTDAKVIQNVSVEDWDCPHPGKRKYMPRHVKENIKRNMEKLNRKQDETDSLQVDTPIRKK